MRASREGFEQIIAGGLQKHTIATCKGAMHAACRPAAPRQLSHRHLVHRCIAVLPDAAGELNQQHGGDAAADVLSRQEVARVQAAGALLILPGGRVPAAAAAASCCCPRGILLSIGASY